MNNIASFTKSRIIYLLLFILLIIIVVSLSVRKKQLTTPSNNLTPTMSVSYISPTQEYALTPTKRPGGGPQPGVDYFEIDAESLKRNKALGNLLSILPYSGKNFTLDFSYKEFTYKLIISENNKVEGEKEFEVFLKSNNVESRTWLEDLIVEYK